MKAARAKYYPEISLEGRIRSGNDIDGVENRTNDMQAKVVTRFNLFNGGIDAAGEQEQIRRLGEAQLRLQQVQRDVEEAVRTAWDKRINQASLVGTLKSQAQLGKGVVDAYEEQFTAGRRSLLDLLSAQNTYVNTLVVGEIARYAELFAAYRVMAAMGELLPSLGLRPSLASAAYAREQARVPQPAADETMRRYSPDRSSGYGIWRTEVTRWAVGLSLFSSSEARLRGGRFFSDVHLIAQTSSGAGLPIFGVLRHGYHFNKSVWRDDLEKDGRR